MLAKFASFEGTVSSLFVELLFFIKSMNSGSQNVSKICGIHSNERMEVLYLGHPQQKSDCIMQSCRLIVSQELRNNIPKNCFEFGPLVRINDSRIKLWSIFDCFSSQAVLESILNSFCYLSFFSFR